MIMALFHYFIFPGFLFLAVAGVLVSWVDRKVTARVQWRQGPPLLQPAYDIIKLFMKEIVIPAKGNMQVFVVAPVISLLCVVLIATMIMLAAANPEASFNGDLLVILYLFTMIPISSMLGASSSGSPFASLGAAREMKLILSYELPLVMALLVPVFKAGTLSLGALVEYQQAHGPFAGSLSGFLALAIALVCLHGKMGLVPFDAAEAEQEISGGSLVEYTGPLLAVWKLSKMIVLIAGPLFLTVVFWGRGGLGMMTAKYIALLVAAILIRNTNPRLRIDQIVKLFWGPVAVLAALTLTLAIIGF